MCILLFYFYTHVNIGMHYKDVHTEKIPLALNGEISKIDNAH